MSRGARVALGSLIPIALGHVLAIGVVVFAVVGLGMAIDTGTFRIVSGLLLIGWGVYHWLYGHHHHFDIGVTTGLFGLGVWSFLMATAHGAGVMLIPVLMPLEQAHHAHQAGAHAHHMTAMDSLGLASLAVVVHSLAMLIDTGAIALVVYLVGGLRGAEAELDQSRSRLDHRADRHGRLAAFLLTPFPLRAGHPMFGSSHQQSKGGDPVSHCHSPRSEGDMAWMLASGEV